MSASPVDDRFSAPHTDMRTRLISGSVLFAAAMIATYLGGAVFAAVMSLVAALVMYEWAGVTRLTGAGPFRAVRPAAIGVVAAAVFAMPLDPMVAVSALLVAVLASALVAAIEPRFVWLPAGVAYAGLPAMAFIELRGVDVHGLVAVIFVFCIVTATDSVAYLVGRNVGGPKLWPRVSPKKTWSGALGGAAAGVAAGLLVALVAGLDGLPVLAFLALSLSVVSQGGDLFESAVKRHFGAKDSGTIIPGHGGVMDRVDGMAAAALLAAAIGMTRSGGFDAVGSGLLLW
jgi:phosphatidate cytidylyltransferase